MRLINSSRGLVYDFESRKTVGIECSSKPFTDTLVNFVKITTAVTEAHKSMNNI